MNVRTDERQAFADTLAASIRKTRQTLAERFERDLALQQAESDEAEDAQPAEPSDAGLVR